MTTIIALKILRIYYRRFKMNDQENKMKSMMGSNYGDGKASKATELNSNMSITGGANDDLTTKLRGGLN